MGKISETIRLDTLPGTSVTNITAKAAEALSRSGVDFGIAAIYSKHTTAAVAINEDEEGIRQDIENYLGRLAPQDAQYAHDRLHVHEDGERKNGHAHLKAIWFGASQAVPVIDGMLALGRWQSVLFIDFDGPRKREVIIQIIGEKK